MWCRRTVGDREPPGERHSVVPAVQPVITASIGCGHADLLTFAFNLICSVLLLFSFFFLNKPLLIINTLTPYFYYFPLYVPFSSDLSAETVPGAAAVSVSVSSPTAAVSVQPGERAPEPTAQRYARASSTWRLRLQAAAGVSTFHPKITFLK